MNDQQNTAGKPVPQPGKVILAGAGCGDPELVTVKVARYLGMADVVLTDRLVSTAILDAYVRKEAKVISVGKQCSRAYSTPQESINALIAEHALQGKMVVRLKGGDTAFFSNILDELQTLTQYHIPYEIVPGITAATGASAYAGIPLTARGYANGVRFLTFYKSDTFPNAYWKELAHTEDTLVFYMSSGTLATIVEHLLANQIPADHLLAVVEQATTPMQSVWTGTLKYFSEHLTTRKFASPSLVIIGKVVALHEKFAWLPNSENSVPYFTPVGSLLPAGNTFANASKHVTRA